ILRELKHASLDKSQIHPVEVPMLINTSWDKCFSKTHKLYTEAKYSERIKMLAYSYHLRALILACPHNQEIEINSKNRAMWIRIYHLFKTVKYHNIYRTKKLKSKTHILFE
ncbi:16307_t:CDS:1, partial [Racocetra fulgida]